MVHKALFAPGTKKAIEGFVKNPGQVLLVTGPDGSGKSYVSRIVATAVLDIPFKSLDSYPYNLVLSVEKQSISISSVRDLQSNLVRITPGDKSLRRVVRIDNAHLLTIEAQNALLKTLEEPPKDTLFILTTPNQEQLLPTVVSRSWTLEVAPVTKQAAIDYFMEASTEALAKAHAISGGRVGLMAALLRNESHELIEGIDQAKIILASPVYDRLLRVNDFSEDKVATLVLLDALSLVANAAVKASANRNDVMMTKRWDAVFTNTNQTREAITKNASPKLALTDLFMKL